MKQPTYTKAAPFFALLSVFYASAVLTAADHVRSHPPMRPLPTVVPAPLAKGPLFYVDGRTADDQNDGTEAKPWKTVQHGVGRLKPGDTLYVRAGIYHEKVYLHRSGSAEAPITIAAYPGEQVVLDGGLKEFLNEPSTSWEPCVNGVPGEYVSTKLYPRIDQRRVPH